MHRFRLRQVDYDGVFSYSAEVEVAVELQAPYKLGKAYPNPFSTQTRFTLALAKQQRVQVEVVDLLGRRVTVLHDGALTAGEPHLFVLDAVDRLSGGVYFFRIIGEHFQEVQSVTLLK